MSGISSRPIAPKVPRSLGSGHELSVHGPRATYDGPINKSSPVAPHALQFAYRSVPSANRRHRRSGWSPAPCLAKQLAGESAAGAAHGRHTRIPSDFPGHTGDMRLEHTEPRSLWIALQVSAL